MLGFADFTRPFLWNCKDPSLYLTVPGFDSASDRIAAFDFVFVIRLRYADKVSSLPELIVAEHKLGNDDINTLTYLIKQRTKYRVLILMDGYDEYQPGVNTEVDKAIDSTIGECFLILTSRPGYLNKKSRDEMEDVIFIEGLSRQ